MDGGDGSGEGSVGGSGDDGGSSSADKVGVGESSGVEEGNCDGSIDRSGGDSSELGRLEAGGWLGVGEVGSRDLRRMAKGIRFAAGQLWVGDGGEVWRTGDGGDAESGWL